MMTFPSGILRSLAFSGGILLTMSPTERKQVVDEVFDRTQPLKTITEYAQAYGVTPGHLNKVVRTRTGRSASEWVQVSRLNYAKYLLRDTSLPVIDVAAQVGLFDQSYFARFFKKHTGLSPIEYREKTHQ